VTVNWELNDVSPSLVNAWPMLVFDWLVQWPQITFDTKLRPYSTSILLIFLYGMEMCVVIVMLTKTFGVLKNWCV